MADSTRKNARTLDMYARLCEGRIINKKQEADRFGVDERSIQRDIDDIRAFLCDRSGDSAADTRAVVYDRSKEGFVMTGAEGSLMSNDEILAVSMILLESRAFTREELSSILDKITAGCVPYRNMKLVTELLANEKFHYVEPRHRRSVKGRLWELGEEIQKHELLEITYGKKFSGEKTVRRIVEPVGLIFSEYYFYLNAFIVEKDSGGKYAHKYDHPAVFRVDRILSSREIGEKFQTLYADRFQEGEFRKRIQFMSPGDLIKLRFRFTGKTVEAILDRLPTAQVVSEDEGGTILEAEVYGKGILMWLLSQGSTIEVLRPQSVREEMKRMLQEMLEKYR